MTFQNTAWSQFWGHINIPRNESDLIALFCCVDNLFWPNSKGQPLTVLPTAPPFNSLELVHGYVAGSFVVSGERELCSWDQAGFKSECSPSQVDLRWMVALDQYQGNNQVVNWCYKEYCYMTILLAFHRLWILCVAAKCKLFQSTCYLLNIKASDSNLKMLEKVAFHKFGYKSGFESAQLLSQTQWL